MIEVRTEQAQDRQAIRELTRRAFAGKAYADGTEPDLIDKLRDRDALTLSLVALDDGQLVGHVAFSPVHQTSDNGPWYGLGPVSVAPERQHEGIGTLLIETGLSTLKDQGALGCILTGDPNYYRRFGFELSPSNCPDNEPEKYFMLKRLAAEVPTGKFAFHPAFYDDA